MDTDGDTNQVQNFSNHSQKTLDLLAKYSNQKNPEDKANCFSKTFMCWVDGLINIT